ncbi:MAG: SpoIID/LytB domain-containing protein [Planctomycetes bacterium]|nr:SpoIID/LytB domain-containing protein [Planctomycetota bacterium]MBU1518846.1 SpoIID/LytB domain-containing protein [Planctomycetota bacterium]
MRTKIFGISFIICAVISILLTGCVGEPESIEPVVTQNPPGYQIRVLLYDSVKKIFFKIDDEYQIISCDTSEISKAAETPKEIEITVDSNAVKMGQQQFNTRRLVIQPQNSQPFAINHQKYRGELEIVTNPDNKTLMVINNVPMEAYLAGVVASEMPSYWETEALKAQAIAARTYCLYIKSRFGKNRSWDVKATQANQVYRGVRAEILRTNDAVNSTFGMVLCCEQESGCEPFGTYYSSVCGGHTENSKNVFGDKFEPLKGVNCPYCRESTKTSLFYWPDVKYDKKTVTKNILGRYPSLKELGTINKIEAVKESKYNGNLTRITSVKLTGSTGKTGFLRTEDLRLAIDSSGAKIQSTCCAIVSLEKEFLFVAGKGFGHGVGLCQYGAREMARQGKTAEQILNFYYPGSRIKNLY